MSFSIGDLRRAHRQGDRWVFWGAPAMLMSASAGFGLLIFAAAVSTRESVLFVGYLVLVPMFLIACFMPGAAIYTDLE